ncbi:hypothetical protein FT641_18410 [Bacillus paranthracis]|uniref:hypothetical protein n=1 Tax=Bacillus paranthracis TaxID=2026186 RepID=UPI001879E08A|nr:hypothetical protein [Bacillus paranthracis]MBE7114463.1 hypothetical protein [Bacillus paranthracis]MBE7154663.1 hypothetical protein [Bacillus paranthracis]
MEVREYVQVNQLGMQFYMFSVTAGELIKNYTLDIHHPETNPTGYQRELIPTIYRDMANVALDKKGFIFYPEQVIGAIDKEDVKVENGALHISDKIRIVAEQYMVKALDWAMQLTHKRDIEDADEVRKNISTMKIPFTLLVIDNELGQKRYELTTFIRSNRGNIVDVAREVKEKMFPEVLDYLNDEGKLYRKIGENVATFINDKSDLRVWRGSLYTNKGGDNMVMRKSGFGNSMHPIIAKYVGQRGKLETLEQIKEVEAIVAAVVSGGWDIVSGKWEDAFNMYGGFNSNYMIQKAAGVRIIHSLLADCMPNFEAGNEDFASVMPKVVSKTLHNFKSMIDQSPVNTYEWRSGGVLSSYKDTERIEAVKGQFQAEECEK